MGSKRLTPTRVGKMASKCFLLLLKPITSSKDKQLTCAQSAWFNGAKLAFNVRTSTALVINSYASVTHAFPLHTNKGDDQSHFLEVVSVRLRSLFEVRANAVERQLFVSLHIYCISIT